MVKAAKDVHVSPGGEKVTWGRVRMRREDSRAHSCFYFIDYDLGGDNALFKSTLVPGRPELVESDIENNAGNSI